VLLSLKVVPRASRTEWAGMTGSELRLRVTAPPVDSAANAAVTEFVAESLEVPRREVRLVRGPTQAHKTVLITGLTLSEVARRLNLKA
jgi:uncharacterized protein (TIGR00251 family)